MSSSCFKIYCIEIKIKYEQSTAVHTRPYYFIPSSNISVSLSSDIVYLNCSVTVTDNELVLGSRVKLSNGKIIDCIFPPLSTIMASNWLRNQYDVPTKDDALGLNVNESCFLVFQPAGGVAPWHRFSLFTSHVMQKQSINPFGTDCNLLFIPTPHNSHSCYFRIAFDYS